MDKALLKQQVIAAVDAFKPQIYEIARFLHANPELGGQEHQAAQLLCRLIEQQGFTVKTNISGYETAFVACKGAGRPRIAFLAEYDALPTLGHACGHNLIAAMSWGAAAAFSTVAGTRACCCLIGCPAEETTGAKVAMADDGVFDDLTAALIVHPGDTNAIGGTSYASHPMKITFYGRPAHVANQHDKGVNALDALTMFYSGVKQLRHTFTQETILAGIITKGGTAPNIVTAEAEAKFTVRALSAQYLEDVVVPAVRRFAEGIAVATSTTVEVVHYEPLFKELINDERLSVLYDNNMQLLGEATVWESLEDVGGSTDVGNVSHVVPTTHPDIAIGAGLVAHTPAFACAAGSDYALERALVAAKAMAMTAVDLLE